MNGGAPDGMEAFVVKGANVMPQCLASLLCGAGRQPQRMQRILWCALSLALFVVGVRRAEAGFTSMYVFGDGLSTTTNLYGTSGNGLPNYYGNRFSNGRVWVEVLAQRQELTIGPAANWSFFGHYSQNLATNAAAFNAPSNASTALLVIWVNNADFVQFLQIPAFQPFASNNIAIWTNAMNQSVSNHLIAVQTLYNKGFRTMVMPVAVDITKVPYFTFGSAEEFFVRQRIIQFNALFRAALQQKMQALTGLRIVTPDFFTLTDDVIAHPTTYGMTNSVGYALDEVSNISFTGPGTNYVFWDYMHPTAKVHAILADIAHQALSPTRIASVAAAGVSNQLTLANMPVGLGGFVEGTTNFAGWSPLQSFASTNAAQTLLVPATGPKLFYRLRFPFAWTWP